jgi:cell wall-associated NlpC family hydrolase
VRCAVEVADVRAEPDEGAEQVTQLLRAEPVTVEETRGAWARIVTAYGYAGWTPAAALEEGDGQFVVAFAEPLEAARSFLGAPYEWGGMTRAGIDCSGLVHVAYRLAGRLVPRDSWQQEAAGEPNEAGGLVSYGSPERADHVAFRLGDGRILHATGRDGLGVVEEPEPEDLAQRRRKVFRL